MGEQRGELRGEQRGKQLGIHQERQRSILYMIRDHLEDNIPHERILHRLQTRYQMTTNEANQYLNQVMNEMA